ncbi:MAG: TadE/TadG family type IV pilus assembly protein [Adlercreutzia equolifaciens]
MGRMGARARDARGQSTVEAAVALPVVFLLVLLLVQPGIVLYDRMVMAAAARAPASGDERRRCGDLRGVRRRRLGDPAPRRLPRA